MSTQYFAASSLDGFIADRQHALDWLLQFDEGGEEIEAFVAQVGALAMGSATYEWLLRHHVKPGAPDGQPWPYAAPCWVFSTRELPPVAGADIRFVRGDVRPVHAAMLAAAQGRNVWVMGGGELAGQFHDHGLLDELIVSVASVTLGSGQPLLPRRIATPPLRLREARRIGNGLALLHYDVPKPAR